MSRVAVVSDTTHYLPHDLAAAHDIRSVSLYVNWPDGTTEREGDMPSFAPFYERLRDARDLPTTSQPSIGDFLAVYEPLLASGHDILSIHLSGGISGTVESARQAAEQLDPSRIAVVDSSTACGGIALMLVAAASVAEAGGDLQACVDRARATRDALGLWFAVDTLDYLQRGGRIGKAQAMLGSALKIKPILSLEHEITPVERVRTSARAFAKMVDLLRERHAAGADGWVVQHIQAPDEAARIADAGREIFGCEPQWVGEIGPVIGAHIGPGLLGVGGVPLSLLRA